MKLIAPHWATDACPDCRAEVRIEYDDVPEFREGGYLVERERLEILSAWYDCQHTDTPMAYWHDRVGAALEARDHQDWDDREEGE